MKWKKVVYRKVAEGIYLNKNRNQLEFDVPEIIKSMGYLSLIHI